MTTNTNGKPWTPKPLGYVRIKADCPFHGMVGRVDFVHGREIAVYVPQCYETDGYANSTRLYLHPGQLWPATEEEYEEAKRYFRVQTPKEDTPP